MGRSSVVATGSAAMLSVSAGEDHTHGLLQRAIGLTVAPAGQWRQPAIFRRRAEARLSIAKQNSRP
ncbi:hypothetical protein GGQ98_000354 [Sphingosinicella soli]|uniref:Uncharacterized protein n=1 Tax=Sphingosinicella soli TaxID=333708 RepID=A0A7W7AYJ6_9SPHN|nr:hypothetical protein [Sphingosinicella soli]